MTGTRPSGMLVAMDDIGNADVQAATEVEIKLTLPARLAAHVMRHPAIERLATSAPMTERLLGIYYDTAKFELMAQGVGLRVRKASRGWIQTIKFGGSVRGGLHQRVEVETPVADQSLDLSLFDGTDARIPRIAGRVLGRLKPRFVTDFARTSRPLKWPSGGLAELSLDRGAIVAGTAHAPICEMELELKGATLDEAFNLIEILRQPFRLRPEYRSKA